MDYKKRVGVDVDGVLREITPVIMELFKKHHPDKIKQELVDGWDFPNVDLPVSEKMDFMFKRFPKEVFLLSKPFKDAKKEFDKLQKWADDNEVFLVCVTHQNDKLIHLTYMWLATHMFIFKEIHVGGNKHEKPVDYLIDDSPENYEKWVKAGRDPKEFILFDSTYSKHIDAPVRIEKLTDAIDHIEL